MHAQFDAVDSEPLPLRSRACVHTIRNIPLCSLRAFSFYEDSRFSGMTDIEEINDSGCLFAPMAEEFVENYTLPSKYFSSS